DLFVEGDTVYVRTTQGPKRVDVIYRRIDDAYLDPEFFLPDSMLGVPGLMRAYAKGRVALANAPGNGCADDKAIYPLVPDIIRYYLGEEARLPQIDTFVCARPDDLAFVVGQLEPGRRVQGHVGADRRGRRVISRVADYCFWFGRYVERAESTARLLQATRALVFDAGIPVTQCWQPLVIVSGELPTFEAKFGEAAAGDGERVQAELTWNPELGASLLSSVRAARECGRVIRDVLSHDTWETVNELYHFIGGDSARRLYREDREELYRS